MDYIRFMRTVRRIEREAARRGYGSDCTADDAMLPDTGTLGQQLDMATIGLDADIRLHDLSTADQQLVRRLIRTCVLTPRPVQASPRRAWRQAV